MDPLIGVSAFTLLCLLYVVLRARKRASLADIPGPQPGSFLIGNLAELHQEQAGEADFRYQAEFGGVARIKAPFGVDMLWLCDPKALQYIYQTSGYSFPKQPERRVLSGLMGDHGLTWADGETHRRQRKVMLPAFGSPEAKALLPVFEHYAEQVTLRWREIIEGSPDRTAVLNVIKLIAPATLDAIGEAAFDYKLGCMDDSDNELAQAYNSLVAGIFASPSKSRLFWTSVAHYLPIHITEWLYANLPGRGLDKARQNKRAAHKIARQLLDLKSEALLYSKGNRDVMSIIVKANTSEDAKTKLADDEMIAQMRTIMLAGQETSSNTLSFALYELAKNPHYQDRLRAEIRSMEHSVDERGGTTFTTSDFDSMPFLQAFVREVLRYHPAVPHNYRQAMKDDVLPLSKPIRTLSGKIVNEIPILKGTRLTLSVAAYNREKDVWGEDAHLFNPERFLDFSGKRGPTVGVFANILTFSGGIRACIGWRLAVLELQTFLCQLVSNFEFSMTEELKRLRRENAIVMVPTLDGEPEKGVQLPLRVSFAARS